MIMITCILACLWVRGKGPRLIDGCDYRFDENINGRVWVQAEPTFELDIAESVVQQTFNPVQNLAVENCETSPTLTWEAPTTKAVAEEILNENFDAASEIPSNWTILDVDGDGFVWEYGIEIGVDGSGCISSESYNNSHGVLTPNNYIFTPVLYLNGSILTYKVCAQDASWPSEHYGVYVSTSTNPADCELVFEETLMAKNTPATQQPKGMNVQGTWYERTIDLSEYTGARYIAFRHFNSTDNYRINIDNVVVTAIDGTQGVIGYSVTRNGEMLATVDANTLTYTDNYAFPTDDKTYCVVALYGENSSESVCVECAGVQIMNPVQNLMVNNCETAPTLTWAAPAIQSEAEEILNENFDAASEIPSDWTILDVDGDGFVWEYGIEIGVDGSGCISSESYNNSYGALTPDNYIFTPVLHLNGSILTYKVCAQDASWPSEHYGVYVSTSTDPADCELVFEETLTAKNAPATQQPKGVNVQGTWYERTIDLSAYTGARHIAFRHFNSTDNYRVNIDNVVVTAIGTMNQNVTGYNVTRNGELLATLDTNTLTYTDNNAPEGDKTYCVVAVYGENMSESVCVECQGAEWQIGDVNHDGTVTLADLQMLLAYIVQNNPQGFYIEQADVNGDGVINLGDMQAMVNIILGNKSRSL